MDDDNHKSRKHNVWFGIGEKVVSFVIGVVIASFFLGGARARVQNLGRDMENWKTEWKERDKDITRMDLEGSVATKNFINHYNDEQRKQYSRLDKLEEQTSHLETLEHRMEQLERKLNNGEPRKRP
jgi:hypothetical protein